MSEARPGRYNSQPAPPYVDRYDTIVSLLRLSTYFKDIDDDLMRFAVYGDGLRGGELCRRDPQLAQRLEDVYFISRCNNRLLETHGDRILATVVADKVTQYFALAEDVAMYMIRDLTSNYDLAAVAIDMGICVKFGYTSSRGLVEKHNVCSNVLESVAGALWVQYGLAGAGFSISPLSKRYLWRQRTCWGGGSGS